MSSTFSRCKWDGVIILDPIQKVRLVLFKETQVSAVSIELVEPAESESPVSRFLERGEACTTFATGWRIWSRTWRSASLSARSSICPTSRRGFWRSLHSLGDDKEEVAGRIS